jgi:hypothetical protein
MPDNDVTCACGARFGHSAWMSLSVVARIEPEEARTLVLNGPENIRIDVRRCRRCARSIATKRAVPEKTTGSDECASPS